MRFQHARFQHAKVERSREGGSGAVSVTIPRLYSHQCVYKSVMCTHTNAHVCVVHVYVCMRAWHSREVMCACEGVCARACMCV